MRILEVNKFFHERRGAERHFLDAIDLLRSRGHEVAVFSMRHPKNIATPYEKYFVSRVGYNRDDSTLWQRLVGIGRLFWSFEARRNMRRLLDDFRPDVVHIHNAYHQLSLSFLPIIRKRGIPIVMTVHDYHLISPDKDEYQDDIGKRYWKFLLKGKYGFGKRVLLVMKSSWERIFGFADFVDRFIAPSEFVKRSLVRGGIPEGKIAVIPHFLADDAWAEAPSGDDGYALYFGGVSEEKGISGLASMFDRLRLPLRIVGPLQGGFSAKDSEYVKFLGQKTKEELGPIIARAKCVVSPSKLPETFGLVVLEGYAFGKPFFGYDTGAFPELVETGKTGMLVPDEAALEEGIRKFFSGGLPLAEPDGIVAFAKKRWGADAYHSRVSEILNGLQG